LERCLVLAEQNYPKVHEAMAKLAKKRADLGRAYGEPYGQFKLKGGIAPAPSLSGYDVYSRNDDVALNSDLSLAWQLELEGAIPLWTFGKLSNGWDAARSNVKLGEHELRKVKNETLLAVRKAYYGVLLARDALALVRDAQRRIDKYLVGFQKRVEAGDGDDAKLLEMQVQRAELDVRESEARKQEQIALAGLRFLTGVTESFDVPDEPITQVSHRLTSIEEYVATARSYRPELAMARAGVRAREAQVRLERARRYPDVGLGLSWRYGRAPDVTDQRNPFVRDPFNYHHYGAAVVFEWKLDPLGGAARLQGAKADLNEVRATQRFALGGITFEVEQAFAEAKDAETRLLAYTRAVDYAKAWLVKVQQGVDLGTEDEDKLVDPAKEYATKRFAQMSAVFDYNVAVARLALVTGWDPMAR
jgi:outer membrane protein TolC